METYKDTGWKFNLESSLSVPWEQVEKVIPYIECYLIDSKDMDPERYHAYTDGDVSLFRANLAKLLEAVGTDKVVMRVPYIEGYNTREQVKENCDALTQMGVKHLDVFDYRLPKMDE